MWDIITDKIAVLLPRGFFISLLPQTNDDMICDRRTVKIIKRDRPVTKTISLNIYSDFEFMSNEMLFSLIIAPSIDFLTKEESKMTRDEAIIKLNTRRVHTGTEQDFLSKLEALGLIKFDKEPEGDVVCSSINSDVKVIRINGRHELWIDGVKRCWC